MSRQDGVTPGPSHARTRSHARTGVTPGRSHARTESRQDGVTPGQGHARIGGQVWTESRRVRAGLTACNATAKLGQAWPDQAKPNQVKPGHAGPGQARPSRAKRGHATTPGQARPSQTKRGRAGSQVLWRSDVGEEPARTHQQMKLARTVSVTTDREVVMDGGSIHAHVVRLFTNAKQRLRPLPQLHGIQRPQ